MKGIIGIPDGDAIISLDEDEEVIDAAMPTTQAQAPIL